METDQLLKFEASSAIFSSWGQKELEILGNQLAEKKGYPCEKIEALHYHLIQKHNWLPRDVRSMSTDDLRLALASELKEMEHSQELSDFRSLLISVSAKVADPLT